ncbi:MAG: PLP-dependent aminotransferase family protein [candidate division Zixibacteria bacterium]|nr:PLP-dependent aminotransferase family protein [candidate division Zixibacteria bacterium]
MTLNWIFSDRAWKMKSSAIREILKITERPEIISFAGGLPAPELFPIKEIKEACIKVLDNDGEKALQYSLTLGYIPLRKYIAERLSEEGTKLTEENIVITSGSQQGLDLVGKAFLYPGTFVIVENPTYLGALQAFNAYHPHYVTVDMDRDGMIIDQVEEAIKRSKPRFIYAVPNFQNPSGITMSFERRKLLVKLAQEYYVPIIDDNPYGELRYKGENVPSLKSLGGDLVIQLGTVSKLISPGIRIGWIAASTEVMGVFERMKQGTDLHTNTFAQYIIYEYVKAGHMDSHIEKIKESYAKRMEVMLKALEDYFPEGITWTKPEGGLFLWVELPEGASATELLDKAIKEKVAYVPGKFFFAREDKDNTLRLTFCTMSEEIIVEGIKRLAKVFKENIKIKQVSA